MGGNIQTAAAAAPTVANETVTLPRDAEAYANFRLTGELPAPKESKDSSGASETSKKSIDSDTADKAGQKSAPAPEADKETKEQTKTRSTAQSRLEEILADLKQAGLSPAELKTFKREAKRLDDEAAAKEAAPSEKTVNPLERPKRPKQSDFYSEEDWEKKFEDAMDAYEQKLDSWREAEFERKQVEKTVQKDVLDKLASAKQRYGDAAQDSIGAGFKSIFNDAQIPGAVKALINSSPVMVDLLYVMGSKSEDLAAFVELAKTDPAKAIRQAVLMEKMVADELESSSKGNKQEASEKKGEIENKTEEAAGKETPERGEDGKFVSSRKISKAPPPGDEIGGSKGTPPDEAEEAAKTGDFRRFMKAENRRDLERMHGR
jgi:hypothetical protein